ncbi:putative baseplate assembly protein [Gloeocapsopsis dulcis]|uniref:Putative baseplate assembly protein n=1 Tax=Gloeocapsopsis dulcis AAB1 = 1H9 TaxID=1433147 RepID=A0A6N8FP33_9CHRO|nr:putative baseplate assembly protein [Gloeocapsopsis dulcis]MUL34951.1 putative baseplate assembly protein [Gloeocapsopsis dulcis AAB1 = 1H9]WNN89978.1 putative baseplate assembly protein [Gloeocapsopsis dulcis]
MTAPAFTCKNEQRRHLVRSTEEFNGLDYLEVSEDQRILTVYLLNKAPDNLTKANVRIDGGRRVRNIEVINVAPCRVDEDCIKVSVNQPGDFSTYTLRLVKPGNDGKPGNEPLEGFDPRYAELQFSFKAGCPSDLDCLPKETCPPTLPVEPEINYLAKDYGSFRQLILDRLALIMPRWKERHASDIGITLVELLAYVGDYLSYYQDAVATEAYLNTARCRISVRRHVRLIDYPMHEGCNARTWVCLQLNTPKLSLNPKDFYFITRYKDNFAGGDTILKHEDVQKLPSSQYKVFEPIIPANLQAEDYNIDLYQAHNEIYFYTWGDRECCLPRGTTIAWLKDSEPEECPANEQTLPEQTQQQAAQQKAPTQPEPSQSQQRFLNLEVGDVLIFEEIKGSQTGSKADANPTHRHPVRLTRVKHETDQLCQQPYVEIEWAKEDALPFPLCISAIGKAPECEYIENISVAWGNVILVDHGRTINPDLQADAEPLKAPKSIKLDAGCEEVGQPRATLLKPVLFRPSLLYYPVTHYVPFPIPSVVAQQQAQRLSKLKEELRNQIVKLLQKPDSERESFTERIREISRIFGNRVTDRVGLTTSGGNLRQSNTEELAIATKKLEQDVTTKKIRRLEALIERVRGGHVLGNLEVQEIEDIFQETNIIENPSDVNLEDTKSAFFGPASIALQQEPRDALPSSVKLWEEPQEQELEWLPKRDLFGSNSRDRHFAVEIDNKGQAYLRFGDGELGRAPKPETTFTPIYRVGNGSAGNVGAEAISHIVFRESTQSGGIEQVRNPLPAQGGIDPEPLAEVKLFAPTTFRQELQRAITADDYARLAERHPKVQRAAATLRWTGSWYKVQVAIDPLNDEVAHESLCLEIKGYLHRYRRIGHDLVVVSAQYVPVDIEMAINVLPRYLRGQVKAVLLDVFSNRLLPDGKRGFFHPDNFTFGDSIYLSKLVTAAQALPGIESVEITKLQRLYEGDNQELENGVLVINPQEIARLDNDPSFPENGRLKLNLRGGR